MANVMDWGIEMGIFPGIINYCLYVYQGSFSCLLGNIIMIQNMYSVVGYSIHCDDSIAVWVGGNVKRSNSDLLHSHELS